VAEPVAKGMVFVSYAHADSARMKPLVTELKTRFNIFWDADLAPGDVWSQVLADSLEKARCVLASWTAHLTEASFVGSEVQRAEKRGVLLPEKLDADAYIPLGFDRWEHLDLSGWPRRGARGLAPLFNQVRSSWLGLRLDPIRTRCRSRSPEPCPSRRPRSAACAISLASQHG
jgi:TIR domain-containing protein